MPMIGSSREHARIPWHVARAPYESNMGCTLLRIQSFGRLQKVDTHNDAHGSFSWILKDITEQIYDNYGRDYYQVCIQGLIRKYLQLGFVPREIT
jgi:hypothetical protein